MSTKITKFWLSRLLLLLLVTAFITMQWTSSHVHLSEQHAHDGGHHQHQVEAHAHNLDSQLSALQANHVNVVELSQECNSPNKGKQKCLSTSLVLDTLIQPYLLISIKTPATTNSNLSYFDLSTVNPRAPPQIS